MARRLRDLWSKEDGQDLIEYSLLIAFLALACLSVFGLGQSSVAGIVGKSNSQITAANQFAS